MYYVLIALILLVCFLLAVVVLAQNPKGGGISSQFGAGGAAQLMGVKRTGDLLEKLTWGFAIGLMILSLGTHVIEDAPANGPVRSINQQKALESRPAPAPSAPVPAAPGATAPSTAPTTAPAAAPAQPTPAPATGN
ncbi:preprotein translocase subunit SecG [Hymenobacter sp. UYP22]|uniref:preprotein translocase subunit SecG n=1 Tax=Hymenobacter sp. UYP22 TaxID=3156348 RepID=UPI003390AF7D